MGVELWFCKREKLESLLPNNVQLTLLYYTLKMVNFILCIFTIITKKKKKKTLNDQVYNT